MSDTPKFRVYFSYVYDNGFDVNEVIRQTREVTANTPEQARAHVASYVTAIAGAKDFIVTKIKRVRS